MKQSQISTQEELEFKLTSIAIRRQKQQGADSVIEQVLISFENGVGRRYVLDFAPRAKPFPVVALRNCDYLPVLPDDISDLDFQEVKEYVKETLMMRGFRLGNAGNAAACEYSLHGDFKEGEIIDFVGELYNIFNS